MNVSAPTNDLTISKNFYIGMEVDEINTSRRIAIRGEVKIKECVNYLTIIKKFYIDRKMDEISRQIAIHRKDEIRRNLELHVFSYLSDEELAHKISLLSRGFNQTVDSDLIWVERTIYRFGISSKDFLIRTKSWKMTNILLRRTNMLLQVMMKVQHFNLERIKRLGPVEQSVSRVAAVALFHAPLYYPAQSTQAWLGGKLRNITVYKSDL